MKAYLKNRRAGLATESGEYRIFRNQTDAAMIFIKYFELPFVVAQFIGQTLRTPLLEFGLPNKLGDHKEFVKKNPWKLIFMDWPAMIKEGQAKCFATLETVLKQFLSQ